MIHVFQGVVAKKACFWCLESHDFGLEESGFKNYGHKFRREAVATSDLFTVGSCSRLTGLPLEKDSTPQVASDMHLQPHPPGARSLSPSTLNPSRRPAGRASQDFGSSRIHLSLRTWLHKP